MHSLVADKVAAIKLVKNRWPGHMPGFFILISGTKIIAGENVI
jgi:hypothetical protein